MIEEIKPDGFMGQIEFVFQDESRFGTITTLGRSWKPVGEEFEVRMKLGRENLYLFGAVTPSTGELFTQIYEKSNTESMNDFIRKFAASKPDRFIVMIMDRAKWHTTKELKTPKNITLIFLPPVSPQLNPIERLWKIIKADFFHNRLHDSIEDVQSSIMRALTSLTPKKIASICKCSYLNAC